MTLSALWKKLNGYRQPPKYLILDLHSDDEMDLGLALLNADEEVIDKLGLGGANLVRIYSALGEYALQESRKGNVVGNAMIPVRMAVGDWEAISEFCLIAKDQFKEKWPLRVLARIAAETAKTTSPRASSAR